MNPNERWQFIVRTGLMRLVKDSRDFDAIKGIETNDLAVDKVFGFNLGIERARQLFWFIGEIVIEQVAGHFAAGGVHGDA